ncbi:hypothetical protein [Alkalihalobacillus pseudalcaliphilus]|uniref:hypothetical protein n=1 Tax=Alkalihalobacillus pseudalcaliphilus TaxID=79884 RepID=UPI00064D7A57|nr:hypothetical protein [Alkalihalobacillus pseudalcaliphilus]KMK75240.1 hypothetical protein AB990_17580 [Alkalihalobacillus pseudalcaliphilus]
MKRMVAISLVTVGALMILGACQATKTEDDVSEKDQKVEIVSTGGDIEESLTKKEDIQAFIDALQIEKWESDTLPEGATEMKRAKMSSLDTVQLSNLLDNPEVSLDGEIIIYENIPYITLSTTLMDLHFSIPDEVADYLNR